MTRLQLRGSRCAAVRLQQSAKLFVDHDLAFARCMGRALRAELFDSDEVSIVHAVQRCVRRAFLASVDPVSGQDYQFRREWIRRRMEAFASVFAIDVLTYAILSNHMHLIVRNRPDVVRQWSDREVVIRWLKVFPGRRLEEHLAPLTLWRTKSADDQEVHRGGVRASNEGFLEISQRDYLQVLRWTVTGSRGEREECPA